MKLLLKVRMSKYVLLFFNLLILTSCIYVFYRSNFLLDKEFITVFLVLGICFYLCNFVFLKIKITEGNISIRYIIFRKNITKDSIKKISLASVNALKQFGGWGYRINLRGEIGYILSSGDCLKITTTENKVYYVSINKSDLPVLLNANIITDATYS